MSSRDKLVEFLGWSQKHITGDENGQAQILVDRLFQLSARPAHSTWAGTLNSASESR